MQVERLRIKSQTAVLPKFDSVLRYPWNFIFNGIFFKFEELIRLIRHLSLLF